MFKRYTKTCLYVAASALISANASALTIEVQPAPSPATIGDTISVAIVVDDLGASSAPSIGGFDFSLSYDPTLLNFQQVDFSTELDLGLFGSDQFTDASVAGIVDVIEVSFEDVTDLNDLQADSFTLFSAQFLASGIGLSGLSIAINDVSDADGLLLPITQTTNSSITIMGGGTAVIPTPSSFVLLLSAGLLLLRKGAKTA